MQSENYLQLILKKAELILKKAEEEAAAETQRQALVDREAEEKPADERKAEEETDKDLCRPKIN